MVTQRPLEALFLVRVQAGQPTQILSNRRTVSEIRRNRSNLHWRTETRQNAVYSSAIRKRFSALSMDFRTFQDADGFGTFPANSAAASLLLNSATSCAMTYRRFAIRCVPSQPRFSRRHAVTFEKPVISQNRCNEHWWYVLRRDRILLDSGRIS
jgi:hypothetical protein